jgi:chromosome segregation ATPase
LKCENSDLKLKVEALNNQISSQEIKLTKLNDEISEFRDKLNEIEFLNQDLNKQIQKQVEEINDKTDQYSLLKKKSIKLKQTIRLFEGQQLNSVNHSDIQTNSIEIFGDVNDSNCDKKL